MVKVQARKFSGEENKHGVVEEPGRWLKHFEITCGPNNWLDDEAKKLNFPVFLVGEAEDWYYVNEELINDVDTDWDNVKALFIDRFRPDNYQDEIEDRLRTPMQKVGESVRAYLTRYTKLHAEGGPATPTLNNCRRFWIAGLQEDLKIDVMMENPRTFMEASNRAIQREKVINAVNRDKVKQEEGKRPAPEKKQRSGDATSAERLADAAAGVGRKENQREEGGKDVSPEDDPRFPEFYQVMSPEIKMLDPSVDEL